MEDMGQRRRPCEDRSLGTCEAIRSGKDKESSPPEPLEGLWPCWHLDPGLWASRTVRDYISAVLSQEVYGYLTSLEN